MNERAQAFADAINLVRDLLRDESSPLTYEAATLIQTELRRCYEESLLNEIPRPTSLVESSHE
jgi:hypothetical protein